MDIRKLQRAIVDGLEDVKAQNILVFNTEHLSPLFERVIVASGTSNRQTKALASSVREAVKSNGLSVLRTEGEANGEWIIVDCGAAVAHIMQPAIRDYYRLEEIWGDKPVKMKLADAKVSLVKAEEPQVETQRGTPSRKTAPRKAAVETAGQVAATRAPKAAKSGTGGTAATKAAWPAGRAPAKASAKSTRPVTATTSKAAAKSAGKVPAKTPSKPPLKATRTITVNAPVKQVAAPSGGKTAGKTAKAPARKPVTRTVGVARKAAASSATTGNTAGQTARKTASKAGSRG